MQYEIATRNHSPDGRSLARDFAFTGPADVTLSRYFKDHPRLGGRERGVIAEAVYGLLRNRTVYTNFAESGAVPRCAAWRCWA